MCEEKERREALYLFHDRLPSLPPQPGKTWLAVGGLIDGSKGSGSPISDLAKQLSSATYQPYKHAQKALFQGGG